MKLNEIVFVKGHGNNSNRLSSVKNYLAGEPALAEIIKSIMIEEDHEPEHYAQFMKLQPSFVTTNNKYRSLDGVIHTLALTQNALVPHLAFNNKTKTFDEDSGGSVACIAKINDVMYWINANRTEYKIRTVIADSLIMFSHNLDEIDLRQIDAAQSLFSCGWVIFK